jgi:hypothetical protein
VDVEIILLSVLNKCGLRLLTRCSNSLRAGRSGERIPVMTIFSVSVQTGLLSNPASNTMGTVSLCRGVRWPGRDFDHTPPSSAEVKEIVQLYLYSPYASLWPVLGRNLPLPFLLLIVNELHVISQVFQYFHSLGNSIYGCSEL